MFSHCRVCGRALRNKKSAKKGIGPTCERKLKLEDARDNTNHTKELEELDGQENFLDEIRKCS